MRRHPTQRIGYNIRVKLLPLQKGIIYGPVRSRRLGLSLGINLLPTTRKVCSFNCVYCQYGITREPVSGLAPEDDLPTPEEVERALRKALSETEAPQFITFSGNGEPTLHPNFPEIAERVKRVRDLVSPSSKIALLSNSTGLLIPGVRETIEELIELPIMKLDAGEEETFRAIARPGPGLSLARILEGLHALGKPFTIQTLFVQGAVDNSRGPALDAWMARIRELVPSSVQIYSIDRPFPTRGLEIVPPERLEEIARDTNKKTGAEVKAYGLAREKGENPAWS